MLRKSVIAVVPGAIHLTARNRRNTGIIRNTEEKNAKIMIAMVSDSTIFIQSPFVLKKNNISFLFFYFLVEIVNAPPPPKISKSFHPSTPPPPEISKQRSPSPAKGGASQTSLSIEETNKLRAKLGLKPLEIDNAPKDDPSKIKDDLGEFYHKPAPNNNDKIRVQKLREKIGTQKQKRQIEANLLKIKILGECDSDDDTQAWINKSRQLEEEKKKAEERVMFQYFLYFYIKVRVYKL